jgi:hypothetical protein
MLALPCCRAGALLPFAVAVVLCTFFSFSTSVRAGNADLPQPGWDSACSSPFMFCSKVEVYRYWGEYPQERLTFTVDAMSNDINNKGILTVWMLMDQPDIEFAKELVKNDFTVIVIHPRGTKLSTTHYTCPDVKEPRNGQCWISEQCAAELTTANGKQNYFWNASHFAGEQVAQDVAHLMKTLGDGRKNVLLTQGLSSVFALRMLQLRPDLDVGVIAIDYVHPELFDTYGYLGGTGLDVALQHLLALCDDEVTCVGRLGAVEGSWARAQTLMALAKKGKLTCAKRLNWGNSKFWGSSFAEQFRSVLALMLRYPAYPFLPSNIDLMSLVPSMLYRLQRCNDGDVKALNTLYTYVTNTKGFTCPEDVYVQMLWLKNDFTQMVPPKDVDKFWKGQSNRRLIVPAATNIDTFHTALLKTPVTLQSKASKVLPVNATQRILFISADVDPLAPRGAASQASIAFRHFGSTVRAVQMRGIFNQPTAVLTPCIINNLRFYRSNTNWAGEDQCSLDPSRKINFLRGSTKDYYGADDSWDYDKPNSDDGSSRGGGDDEGGSAFHALKRFFRVVLMLLLLAGLGAGAFYAYNYVRDRGFRFHRVSDNFYDNLH